MTDTSSGAHMALHGGMVAQKGEAESLLPELREQGPRPARQPPCHRTKETKSNTDPRRTQS